MDTRADEEEAPTDPAARKHTHHDYTEQDFEGHRAHTVFVGVHVPARRHSHRKHKHHHRNGGKDPEKPSPAIMARVRRLSVTDDGETLTPPAQRVQFILGEDVDDTTLESHPLFSEMEELVRDGDELEWKETARWIKFEEDVEEGGNRWSKPHVATLSLHSLFELRSLILNGSVILDLEANSLEQVAENVLDNMIVEGGLAYDRREKVKDALLRRHRHQYEKRNHNNMSRLPLIRSLADIGKNHSSCKNFQDGGSRRSSSRSCRGSTSSPNTALLRAADARGSYLAVPGAAPDEGMIKSPSSLSMHRNHSSGDLPMNGDVNHKSNTHFMRKIPPGAEASNILVGEVDFLEKTLSAFVRLKTGTIMGDLTEVPVPTRFMFVLLGPPNSNSSFHEIGRAMATLMSDEIFHEVAYRAKKRDHLLAGIDEFLDAVTVLPPGEWDPSIRIEPPAAIPSQDPRKRPTDNNLKEEPDEEEEEQRQREESGLARSGKLFGGLINDLKRKIPWYWSDFKDALALQCIASWIFLYFACLSPIITFGGLLGEATGKNMAAMESLVSGFVCGMGYGFFSGQPLTILGSTGPVLVFETIVFEFCKQIGWNYMSFRFCIGTWTTIILIILVAIDASALVCYITRFTEENFATLIAFIFIYKAVENVISIGKKNPIKTRPDEVLNYECYCLPGNYSRVPEQFNWTSVDKESCQLYNGTLAGGGCDTKVYVPDVFLMSIILFLGTFTISIILKDFKNSLFFPSKVRQIISDFSVIIAILSMSFLDFKVGIKTPKLEVPSEFKPTLPTREWVITPFNGNPVWSALVAILPALLGTILIFMDQQITAVIVNRKENKLKKGCGYHLDLFILAILIQICSIMGLPWFVAATVLSINHVNSLKVESECAAPGEKPQFLGVREQRVTHILIFLTIGCSVVLTPVLRHIPMPVLFGVFLYMGVASLKGLQFFDRILIMFMPQKYQPDHMFLRQVPIRRVHVFTAIQLTCLVCLWVIKSFSMTSILFPLMLVVMIGIRKSLDIFFTRREMKILDDVMPEMTKRNQDELRELADVEDTNKSNPPAFQENLQIPLINGNIMNIPLASINISEEVNKTGIWKQVNNSNKAKARLESKELKAKSGKKTVTS
ncbi:electroneutral sodium bicarbonate exchanger 1 isoform X5 [Nymphalis io]|uniref:electroneutral sodium bicarbonate exchanger 1 isoform X5 n=1 Tax=Inachis io TaxID=171585 RepID=UPI002168A564|nr:electroneutral sodium bicarbonate exchanger 1 isoform X5 [Nymphalis io]